MIHVPTAAFRIGNRDRRHAIGAGFKPVWDGRANETVSKVLYNVAVSIQGLVTCRVHAE